AAAAAQQRSGREGGAARVARAVPAAAALLARAAHPPPQQQGHTRDDHEARDSEDGYQGDRLARYRRSGRADVAGPALTGRSPGPLLPPPASHTDADHAL